MHMEADYFKVMMVGRLKVSFWPDGGTSTGNYGWQYYVISSHLSCVVINLKLRTFFSSSSSCI
jgi:hypothetical protein